MAPSLVYHGLIGSLLSLALNIMSVQLTLAAGKDQLTQGKSGMYFILLLLLFSLYVCLLSIIIIFGVGNLFFLFVCFDLFCFFCFCFVLFILFLYFIFVVVVVFLCFCCYFYVFCFCFWIFGLSCSPLRHFPSVFYFFLPIAVTSYKHCGKLH